MATEVTERALRLISLAIECGIDSLDVEDCCIRHGLSYDESPVEEIRRAVLDDYGVPMMIPPRVVRQPEAVGAPSTLVMGGDRMNERASVGELQAVPTDHRILLAVQRQVAGLVAEKAALQTLQASLQGQIDGLVAERDALAARCNAAEKVRIALIVLIDEAERAILAEQQASGRTLAGLQWAVDNGRQAQDNSGRRG